MNRIVTRRYISEQINNPRIVMHFVGRALVVLLDRQTADEKLDAQTKHTNQRGFAQNDAKSGTITAKYYLKHNKLEDWMVRNWTRDWKGQPRIAKYWKQLDEAAQAKAAQREAA